jgi:hypothetical protein
MNFTDPSEMYSPQLLSNTGGESIAVTLLKAVKDRAVSGLKF